MNYQNNVNDTDNADDSSTIREKEIAIPKQIAREIKSRKAGDVIYAFNYDLTHDSEFTEGTAVLTERFLFTHNSSDNMKAYDISNITDVKGIVFVGCIAIEFKYEEELIEFCRSSLKYQNLLLDFAAQFDLLLKGKLDNVSDKSEKTICPKCGNNYEPGTEYCVRCQSRLKTMGRILKLAVPYRKMIAVAIVIFFISSGLALLVPWLEGYLVDNYIYINPPNESITSKITFADILMIVLGIILLQIIIRAVNIARSIILGKASNHLSYDLRSMIFARIQELSISKISKRTAGELINRVSWDTENLNEFLSFAVPDILQQSIIFIIVSIYMFSYDYRLALMVFLPLPLFFIINTFTWNFLHGLFRKSWKLRSASSTVLHDIFANMKIVKLYGTEKQEMDKCGTAIKNLAEIDLKVEKFWSILTPITGFVMHMGSYFLLFYIGSRILGINNFGELMTRGDMIKFTAYMSLIYGPLDYMTFLPRWISNTLTSAGKLFEIIDEKIDVEEKQNPVKKAIEGYIDFKNLYFGYKDYDMILKDINLKVKPGEMIGIVGKSGAGKSTMINLIMRLYDAQEGDIEIDGVSIKDYDMNNLRSQIGVVLQETFLFSGTIYENIAYAKNNATPDDIIKAAKFANAHQFIIKLPDAYNTKVGENGHTLSGGERQRIAIARAVLHDPRILILDEATSALDTETETLVQESLQKLIKNRTTFAIAHRLATLRHATRLIVIDKGTIAEVGTHDELMVAKGIYYSLVMAQRQMSKMAIAKK